MNSRIKKMKKAIHLESKRLIYEPLSIEYLSEDYVSWLNDPEVNRYMETCGGYTIDSLRKYLEKVTDSDMLFWAIHLKGGMAHIGNIKVDPVEWQHRRGEIGTLIGDKTKWGNGYATEAKKTIIDYCFSELDLIKITSGCHAKNTGTLRVNEKLGFVIEGTFRKHLFKNGERVDTVRMAIFNPNQDA